MAGNDLTELLGTLFKASDTINPGTSTLIQSALGVAEKMWELQEEVSDQYDKLCESEPEIARSLDDAFISVNRVIRRGCIFIRVMADFAEAGSDRRVIALVKEEVLRGDLDLLKEYLWQMNVHIESAQSRYQAVMEACKSAENDCWKGIAVCGQRERAAKRKRTKTRVGGGLGSGLFLAGGVAASVVAGVLTLGVGAIVGLSITAAGSTAIGAGAAVKTANISRNYTRLIAHFRTQALAFQELSRHSLAMKQQVDELHGYLSAAIVNVDHVRCAQRESLVGRLILNELELLWARFDEFQPAVVDAQKRAEKATASVRERVEG